MGDGNLLLELVGLSLKLGSLLFPLLASIPSKLDRAPLHPQKSFSYLGNLEESLGDVNDTAEVLHSVNARLDGRSVVFPRRVEDACNLRIGLFCPLLVGRTSIFANGPENGQQAKGDDGFFVDDVELVADSCDGDTGTGRENGGLGDEAVAREGVEDGLGLLLGLLCWDVGVEAGRGDLC